MLYLKERQALREAAVAIAAGRGEAPAGPWRALSKLVIQEKRNKACARVGWKRGEVWEVLEAALHFDLEEVREEVGDCGYYVAQSWAGLWPIYAVLAFLLGRSVVPEAVLKFQDRAAGGTGKRPYKALVQRRQFEGVVAAADLWVEEIAPHFATSSMVGQFERHGEFMRDLVSLSSEYHRAVNQAARNGAESEDKAVAREAQIVWGALNKKYGAAMVRAYRVAINAHLAR